MDFLRLETFTFQLYTTKVFVNIKIKCTMFWSSVISNTESQTLTIRTLNQYSWTFGFFLIVNPRRWIFLLFSLVRYIPGILKHQKDFPFLFCVVNFLVQFCNIEHGIPLYDKKKSWRIVFINYYITINIILLR